MFGFEINESNSNAVIAMTSNVITITAFFFAISLSLTYFLSLICGGLLGVFFGYAGE